MGNKTGCLIIHGFGGNTYEVEPLAAYLEDKGFMTFCPVLKGHTENRRSLAGVSYREWIESAEDGLKQLLSKCEKVVVIGFSMGGLIAINLSTRYNVNALAALSTPIYYWDIKRIFLNVLQDVKTKDFSSLKRYMNTSGSYPFTALVNFRILLSKTKSIIKKVACPLFIAHGLLDDTANHRSSKYIYNNASSEIKTVRYYENSGHHICLGSESSELFVDIENFINSI